MNDVAHYLQVKVSLGREERLVSTLSLEIMSYTIFFFFCIGALNVNDIQINLMERFKSENVKMKQHPGIQKKANNKPGEKPVR